MRTILLTTYLLFSITLEAATGIRILFMGDSITDGAWGRSGGLAKTSEERNHWDLNHIYGHSYMFLCAAHFQSKYPECEYEFYNRGISGYTLADLEKRWKIDVIDLKPDVLSILIGTNDIDKHLKQEHTEFDFTEWANRYRHLLECTLTANPNIRIILCSPFAAFTGRMKESKDFEKREALVKQCAQVIEKLAKEFGCIHLPFNHMFNQLLKDMPTSKDNYWIWDGIHPTPAGHKRMADMWIQQCEKIFNVIKK